MKYRGVFILFLLIFPLAAFALEKITLDVDGVQREALVYSPPPTEGPRPIVFCYHGHGGSSELFASKLAMEKLWPDAIIVYPQGLNTKGPLTDPEGKKTGWQSSAGMEGDRDIRFFDLALDHLQKKHRVDAGRVFALGFSNGGAFAYTLLSARKDRVAAIAPIAAVQASREERERLIGKSVFHAAGRNDPLVKFAWQAAMVDFLVRRNRCEQIAAGENAELKSYRSVDGVKISFFVDDGKHEIPPAALPLIVNFFKGVY